MRVTPLVLSKKEVNILINNMLDSTDKETPYPSPGNLEVWEYRTLELRNIGPLEHWNLFHGAILYHVNLRNIGNIELAQFRDLV